MVLRGYLEQADASEFSTAVNLCYDPEYDSQEVKIKATAVAESIEHFYLSE